MLRKINWVTQVASVLAILWLAFLLIRGEAAGGWLILAVVLMMISLGTQYLWMQQNLQHRSPSDDA